MKGLLFQTAGLTGRGVTNVADVTGVTYLGPILVFLIVTIVMAALLKKIMILGDNPWVNVFVSLFVAGIFIAASSTRELLLTVIPWFAVLFIALFFILMLAGFVHKIEDTRWIGIIFIVVLIIVFLIATVKIFSSSVTPYLPGPAFGASPDADQSLLYFLAWAYSPTVSGAFWLVLAGSLTAWFLIKSQ